MPSKECLAKGDNHSLPCTGHAAVNTAQDTAGHLCCWSTVQAHVQLDVCHGPQVLLSRAVPQLECPQPVSLQGDPRCRTCCLPLWNFIRLLLAHSSSLSLSLGMVTLPSSISVHPRSLPCPPFWCHLQIWQVHSVISSLIKMLDKTSPRTVPCSSSLVTSLQVMYNPLASTFWAGPSNTVECYNYFVCCVPTSVADTAAQWLNFERKKNRKLESAVTPGTPWSGVYYALLSLSAVLIKLMRTFLPCPCGRKLCKRQAPPKLVIVLGTPSFSWFSKGSKMEFTDPCALNLDRAEALCCRKVIISTEQTLLSTWGNQKASRLRIGKIYCHFASFHPYSFLFSMLLSVFPILRHLILLH